MRITRPMLEEIERLLKESSWSQRKIAREVGISRSMVNNIARGYRPNCQELPGVVYPTGPLVRCPGCGGRVFMPCMLCHIRELKEMDRPVTESRVSPHRETAAFRVIRVAAGNALGRAHTGCCLHRILFTRSRRASTPCNLVLSPTCGAPSGICPRSSRTSV